jgi:hypothetical protein
MDNNNDYNADVIYAKCCYCGKIKIIDDFIRGHCKHCKEAHEKGKTYDKYDDNAGVANVR